MRCHFNRLSAIALVASLVAATDVAAVGQRTFVSATNGSDANPCSSILPCRSFGAAIAQVNAGGEVVVLDSGGFGGFTVTKSVSIIAPLGLFAGLPVWTGNDGITVSAGPSDKVVLRGLTINGQGGNRGIVVNSAGEVHIENCTVFGLAASGIAILGGGHVHVRSTIVRGNGASGLVVTAGTPEVHVIDSQFARNANNGIAVSVGTLDARQISATDNGWSGVVIPNPDGGTTAAVTVADSTITGNDSGVIALTNAAGAKARMSVVRSTVARNAGDGVTAQTTGTGSVFVLVSDSAVLENTTGITAYGLGATVDVTRSTSINIGYDVVQGSAAVLRTSGNNTVTGSGFDVVGSFTVNSAF